LKSVYLEIVEDIILSNDDDDDDDDDGHLVGKTDPLGQDEPSIGYIHVVDDAEVLGKTSAKTVIPDPIMAGG
jgi:hypothetical protein